MPELPEVQTVVTTLQPIVGKRLGKARVLRRDVLHGERVSFNDFAKGREIRAIRRQAKRIIFEIGDDRQILIHLGMTGQLTVNPRHTRLLPHTHLRVPLVGSKEELRFRDVRRFGGVWLLRGSTPRCGRGLGKLGPDPLEVALPEFRTIFKRNRQVKALLLDQSVLAGLGNIYTDEALFKAGIHPLRRASDLTPTEVADLRRAIRNTLRAAIKAGGSSISDFRDGNGERGWFQLRHQAYGREGKPCRRCKALIERIQAGGRSSHICPNCQPLR